MDLVAVVGVLSVTVLVSALAWLVVGFILCELDDRRERRAREAMLADATRAADRAEAMRARLLTPKERESLRPRGWLEVPSPGRAGRVYRVMEASSRVLVYDQGNLTMSLCVRPVEQVPQNELVLVHKLMIEGDEEGYLARANQFAAAPYPFAPVHPPWAEAQRAWQGRWRMEMREACGVDEGDARRQDRGR